MVFTSIYAFLGIACLGIALGVIGSNLVENENKAVHMTEQLIRFEVLSTFDNTSSHHPGTLMPSSDTATEDGSNKANAAHHHDGDQSSTDENDDNTSSSQAWWLHFVMAIIPLCALVLLIGSDAGWDYIEIFYFLMVTCTYCCFDCITLY